MTSARTGFATLYATLFLTGTTVSAQTADLIISGGPILTMEGETPHYASAVAVRDGKIIFVGDEKAAARFKGRGTQIKNLAGKALLPGFIDSHGHVGLGGLQAVSANLLSPPDGPVTDIPSLVATLRAWAAKNAGIVKEQNVIIGFGYDPSQLKEQRHPTKEELDEVSTTVPVMAIHQSGHISSYNSLALKRVGIDSSSKDPEGGVIQRQQGTTEPNGTLEEVAHYTALPKLLGNLGPAGVEHLIVEGAKIWARYGFTTGQEGCVPPQVAMVIKKVADEGRLLIDIAAFGDVRLDRDFIKNNVSKTYTNHYRMAGTKLTIDGSPQGFTAWRDQPYYKPVGNYPKDYAGYPALNDQKVFDAVDWAYANNVQIITHANGERAIDELISALWAAEARHGKGDRRPVLIHGQFQRADQPAKLVALGVIPSLFPMHTFYWGDWHYDHTVGPQEAQNISPAQWYLKAGSIFTTHHDAPVALPNSLRVLDATVNRVSRSGRVIGPDQRVDTYTGLRAMTIWGATQYFEEGSKGSIKEGKLADFVVLSADPLKTDPMKLASLEVVETIKEGNTVYKAK